VLILPPGHAESVRAQRKLSSRERRLIGGVLVVLAALAIALVVSLAASGPNSANGCIYVTIAGPVGAEQIDQCGNRARDTCATALTPGAFTRGSAQSIAAACRQAGLPVGP
jgi:hypothetical protein